MSACLPSLVEITNADNLPTPPAVATEILRLTKDEGVSLDELATVISQDPALTAKLMKLANSSLFARGTDAVSLDQAMMRLGLKTVKLMALSFSLVNTADQHADSGFDFPQFWRRGLVRGVAARNFAKLIGLDNGEEGFLCGLLSRLGQLAMYVVATEPYKAVLSASNNQLPSSEMEKEHLGYDHCEVGGALLEKWELPNLISQVIRYIADPSEMPDETGDEALRLVTVVRVASMAESVLLDQDKGNAMRTLSDTFEYVFDIDESGLQEFLIGMQVSVDEIAEMLDVKMENQDKFGDIVEQARMQMVQISLGNAADLQESESRNEQLEKDNIELEREANTDKMTDLNNRAFFDRQLIRETELTKEAGGSRNLGLLVMDVDKFKLFNDTHGHVVGDEVLKVVANCLKQVTPERYYPARYGGEEFVVIMPDAEESDVKQLAERIRITIEMTLVKTEGKELSVTISVGGACAPGIVTAEQAHELLKTADGFLYEAKEGGRNASVCRAISSQPA